MPQLTSTKGSTACVRCGGRIGRMVQPSVPMWNIPGVSAPEGIKRPSFLDEQEDQLLYRVHVVDGSGWAPRIGDVVSVRLAPDRIEFEPEVHETVAIDIANVTGLAIEGHSRQRGPRVFGGGFGALGALEGLVAAQLLSAILNHVQRWVAIRLDTDAGHVLLVAPDLEELPVRQYLRPLGDAIAARSLPSLRGSDGLLGELERLVEMRNQGLLSEEEWALAKARVLHGATDPVSD